MYLYLIIFRFDDGSGTVLPLKNQKVITEQEFAVIIQPLIKLDLNKIVKKLKFSYGFDLTSGHELSTLPYGCEVTIDNTVRSVRIPV